MEKSKDSWEKFHTSDLLISLDITAAEKLWNFHNNQVQRKTNSTFFDREITSCCWIWNYSSVQWPFNTESIYINV